MNSKKTEFKASPLMQAVGVRFKELRESRGLTLAQAASLTGGALNISAIYTLENGMYEARFTVVYALAVALGTDLASLLPDNAAELLRLPADLVKI